MSSSSAAQALKKCKKDQPECKGGHQLLADSITRGGTSSDKATIKEAVKLYKQVHSDLDRALATFCCRG